MSTQTTSIADAFTAAYPATDIYIKTYSKDAGYHEYCVQSIRKFCQGFRNLVVTNSDEPNGYLAQQVYKLKADEYCPGAEYVLVTDSDTLMCRPLTPATLMQDGKPIWLYTPWTPEMLAHPGTATWKRVVEEFFGVECDSEKMRRQPFYFPSHVLKTLRDFCVARHGVTIDQYIMSRKAFSEWNVLGTHCWLHHHDEFHWVNTATDELPELTVQQCWSHTPLEWNLPAIHSILDLPNP